MTELKMFQKIMADTAMLLTISSSDTVKVGF